jgi:hypothetical protein
MIRAFKLHWGTLALGSLAILTFIAWIWFAASPVQDPLRSIPFVALFLFPAMMAASVGLLFWWSPNNAAAERVGTEHKRRGVRKTEMLGVRKRAVPEADTGDIPLA